MSNVESAGEFSKTTALFSFWGVDEVCFVSSIERNPCLVVSVDLFLASSGPG